MMSAANMGSQRLLSDVLVGFNVNADIPNIVLQNIGTDSQKITTGDVFLATKGVARHGIDFALNANQRQASAVIYDSCDDYAIERLVLLAKQMTVPLLGVEGLNQQYGDIISRCYGEPSKQLKLIGVTGTDGKTSVTHLLTQALSKLENKVGSIGTLGVGIANDLINTGLTTPSADTVQQALADFAEKQCDVVVMEVSSHALDQYRVVGCEFDIALLTNLGSDHLDYHQDLTHYANAKERLFHWSSIATRVLNSDDIFGQALALKFDKSSVLAYSASQDKTNADVVLKSVEPLKLGQRLAVKTPKGLLYIETQLIGDFNIENLLAVVSVLIALDYKVEQIAQACHLLKPIPGRMELLSCGVKKQVIVDFAHTAQALKASLQAAKKQTTGQLWCVFGCGGDRDQSKRAKMGVIAELFADKVVITDDNPRFEDAANIVEDILKGCKNIEQHQVIHDRKTAIEFAISQAKDGDTILIAGKGHESDQLVRGSKIPFSDQYVASQFLRGDL